ncbi:hypothetical protein JX266_001889 [Neoarthrinium moseri]|uniref:uncharacterized protein n=1 Tax=Neoarthrinium moseri TaxID=1658444 RepID=UPI001FDAF4E5|nr:uncharacterized protein JN550_000983 [Neoarthrinium moseri]KAI1853183.1 hypothetical protein JX266_001889 [Neoarthrinium moseri]KAI1876911.1 hypothetical protein JN550_000983 [Neoarthrinium moseri]
MSTSASARGSSEDSTETDAHYEGLAYDSQRSRSSRPDSPISINELPETNEGPATRKFCHLLQLNQQALYNRFDEHSSEVSGLFKGVLSVSNETQQNVAELAAEISSLRQAQLALRQKLNHDQREYYDEVEALKVAFKEELEAVTEVSNEANRQAKALRAEVQLLRRQMATPSWQFPQFKKLPPEIRNMIWRFSLPNNIVHVRETTRMDGLVSGWDLEQSWAPPAASRACREARAVASHSGGMVYTDKLFNGRQWSWFDATRDTLYISVISNEDHEFTGVIGINNIAKVAQYVTLHSAERKYHDCFMQLFQPNRFPNLKIFDFVSISYKLPRRYDPRLESRLFVLGSKVVIVAVGDFQNFIANLRGHGLSCCHEGLEELLLSLINQDQWPVPSEDLDDSIVEWSKFKRFATESWFSVRRRWFRLTGEKGMDSMGKNRCEASIKGRGMLTPSVPTFRRVIVIESG